VRKTLYSGLFYPPAKIYDDGESWDVFTKRVLVKNTLAVSCIKIQEEPRPPLPSVADVHVYHASQANALTTRSRSWQMHIFE